MQKSDIGLLCACIACITVANAGQARGYTVHSKMRKITNMYHIYLELAVQRFEFTRYILTCSKSIARFGCVEQLCRSFKGG